MGKSKCRKSKQRRPRPTGIASLKEMEELEEMSGSVENEADTIDEILEKLLSSSSSDKVCSAAFITQSASKVSFVNQLIERNIVKIASPFIVDPDASVSKDIAACLRSLSVCGGPAVAEAMVEQDVMTSVSTFLKEFRPQGFDLRKLSHEKYIAKKEAFGEVCGLLTSLCENSSAALDIFNSNNLLLLLLPYLKLDISEIILAVVQCLQTVTENNMNALKTLAETKNVESLKSIMSLTCNNGIHIHIKILTTGVLFNLYWSKVINSESSAADFIMQIIENTLNIPIQSDIENIARSIDSVKENKSAEKSVSLKEKEAEIVKQAVNVAHVLTAKQVALEILTNICSSDDSCDMDEDDSWGSFSDDEEEIEEFCTSPDHLTPVFSMDVNSIIVKKKLVQKLPQQILIFDDNQITSLKEITEGQEIVKRLHTVRCRALFCINNVVQALDVVDLGGSAELFKLWMDLSTLMFTRTDSEDHEQMEAAASSVRAVLQKLGVTEGVASQFGQMTESDVKLFFDIYQKTEDANIKANIIRCVATIGCILGNMTQQNSYSLIRVIGSFLTDACAKSSELWVTAEALDALFDVFAEDHLDDIAKEINLVDKLNSLAPIMKSKIKQQKNSLGEHLPIIMTAKTNLLRFLKYKNKCM